MTPTGHIWYHRGRGSGIVVYSHLTGCGGADPGRRCGGSPCLSHCSPSMHESPLDCPKPVILPLYTHAHTHTEVIHSNIDCITNTQIHLEVHQAVSQTFNTTQNANTEHDRQTDGSTNTQTVTHSQTGKKQEMPQNNNKKNTTNGKSHNRKHNTQNYLTPSTCCIAHTCSKTRETAVYGINTTSEESHFRKSQCGWWVRSSIPEKNAK